jgi:polyisoprenoid-binding protein YceI
MSALEQLGGGTWLVDPGFSSVTFSVRHLGMRDYRVGFREIDGLLDADGGTLAISVALDSLDLNQLEIRTRLLSAEFLDSASHPTVSFSASDLRGADDSRDVVVAGELTIHGVTRSVLASGRMGVPGAALLTGLVQVTLELAATIDRRDFGLDWQEELPGGAETLSNDVAIEAVLELVRED